ncbi:MAG: hypothetical protein HYV15_06185 [Elusimicrobia bacterium]|nr:hypothetical protein [Elusimicrobiota bacterium]
MPLLSILLSVCVSAARAEEPPRKEPQVQRFEVPAPEAPAVAALMAQLQGQGVKGLPEGWASAADLAKDPFFSALAQDALFKEGQRTLIVEDGQFRGLLLTHDGKSFLYKPPEPFAVQAPEAGAAPKTVLKLEGGKLTPKPFSSLSDAERRSSAAGAGRVRAFSAGDADRGFDGGVGRGRAPSSPPRRTPRPSRPCRARRARSSPSSTTTRGSRRPTSSPDSSSGTARA